MLRDLIKEQHDRAENHPFVKVLLSGNIDKRLYAEFLYNQYFIYSALEKTASKVLVDLEGIERTPGILKDLKELEEFDLKVLPSTVAYMDYLTHADLTDEELLAHIYVRHMGDMFGGQMIKKVIPGSGYMYDFEDRSNLIKKLREKLNDDMAEEANDVFEYAIGLFEDFKNEYNL
jgi:heme oxygenase